VEISSRQKRHAFFYVSLARANTDANSLIIAKNQLAAEIESDVKKSWIIPLHLRANPKRMLRRSNSVVWLVNAKLDFGTLLARTNTFNSTRSAGIISGEQMGRLKYYKKVAAVILVAIAALIVTVVLIRYLHPAELKLDSRKITPGQTYLAWDGNPAPSGYYFHAIRYSMYINGSVIYGSGTTDTSWTCPEYVYGQEGNPNYKIDYAVAWTDGYVAAHP
jgi:hypothetical protein